MKHRFAWTLGVVMVAGCGTTGSEATSTSSSGGTGASSSGGGSSGGGASSSAAASSSGGGSSNGGSSGGGTSSSSSSSSGGGSSGGLIRIIEDSWSLASGQEAYRCVVRTIPTEMWVSEFHPVIPTGTHHTVLTRVPSFTPDGAYTCTGQAVANDMLFASGVGTEPLIFPTGVAVKLPAGSKILINLHLYNASIDSMLTGTSAIEVRTVPASAVTNEAQMILAGTENISIPSTGANVTLSGRCTVSQPTTLFAMMPHMHVLGRHMKVSVTGGSTPDVLMDEEYLFEEQFFRVLTPTRQLAQGQVVNVDCTYVNETGSTVTFGESTDTEMCFAGLYYWPPINNAPPTCTN